MYQGLLAHKMEETNFNGFFKFIYFKQIFLLKKGKIKNLCNFIIILK